MLFYWLPNVSTGMLLKREQFLPPEFDLDKEKIKFHWGAFFIGVLLALIGPLAGIIFSSSVVLLIVFLLGLAAIYFPHCSI
jgi:hypothetical protein